ncbi:MAG: ABC transporter ATP-binding protein [Cyanobacteria bacterium J06627_8]
MMRLLHHVGFSYGSRLIVDGITLDAAPGEILGLMGPSGCGKTTVLNLLAGLLFPAMGHVAVMAHDTAYVFQEPRLFPWYTAVENIAVGLSAQGMTRQRRLRLASDLAATVGLEKAVDLYPTQLSGGMKQRVNLARAFAANPQLLLLDEPFSSLDMVTRQQLQQMVIAWVHHHQTTAIMVTHDLSEAVTMGDRLLVLSQSPARIVHHWQNDRHPHQRDPAYVYRTLSTLQTVPDIAASFNLECQL